MSSKTNPDTIPNSRKKRQDEHKQEYHHSQQEDSTEKIWVFSFHFLIFFINPESIKFGGKKSRDYKRILLYKKVSTQKAKKTKKEK